MIGKAGMDAILINRVSDAHQLDGYSLDVQEREGRKYASRKQINLIKVFTFQESASKAGQRKEFDEIINFITSYTTKKKPLAVVAEKPDRLYRNHLNKIQFQLFLEDGKVEIHLYKEGKVLTKDSPPSEFLVDDVMTSVNQYTARNIGREAKKGMLGKARAGWFPHRAPFGYLNVHPEHREDKNRRRGIIEPAVWAEALIPRIYSLRASGISLEMIRDRVMEEGLVPDKAKATFHRSIIEKILKNPFYMGEFDWGGERHQGKHRPLISRQLWDKVQAMYTGKTLPLGRKRHRDGTFSGFLRCSCGCQITYDPKINRHGQAYEYYRCANGRRAHARLQYLTEDRIFEQFDPAVESISISEQLASDIAEALNRTQEKARMAHQRHAEALKARLQEMEGAEDRLYDDLKAGLLDEGGYKRQVNRVREARQRLLDALCEAQGDVTDAAIVTAKRILEIARHASELYLRRSAQERRDFLEKILSNPVLDGASVRYELKKPFRILSEMASSPTWGG